MEEELIEKFISIGVDSFEDAESIFRLTTKYLSDIKEVDYNSEQSTLVEGLLNKMISISEYFDLDETLINEIEQTSKNFVSIFGQNTTVANKLPHFNKAFSVSMKFYNAMVKTKPKANLDFGPFKPNLSDKQVISLKITQAIEIITNSEMLTEKAKKRLIDSLNSVLSELHKPTTNWNVYFKNMGYSIMLLGSLGSIAGGAVGVKQLMDGKEKLEEANQEVQQSSISISKKDLKDVFVINEQMTIDAKESLRIETKTKSKKTNGNNGYK